MIAYNTTWLDNLMIQRAAGKAQQEGCISAEELKTIQQRYPSGFYSPNVFARIGFFLLTAVIALFTLGLLLLLFESGIEKSWSALCIVMGGVSYAALEWLVRDRRLYKAGADDALQWLTVAFVAIGFADILDLSVTGISLLLFVTTLFMALRFTNALMAAAATLSLLSLVFYAYTRRGGFAIATIPFLLIVLCALLYAGVQAMAKDDRWKRHDMPLSVVRIVLLVCFYLAGNYFTVRETSNALFNPEPREGALMTAGWFFWCWTSVVPLVYIARGLQKKDVVLLRVGLLLVGMIVFTVRYYHSILPLETAMSIGGVLLIGIAWALIRYLSTPCHGFTQLPADDPHWMDKLQVESLIIAETFHHPAAQPSAPERGFGGGSGSGAGASGEF